MRANWAKMIGLKLELLDFLQVRSRHWSSGTVMNSRHREQNSPAFSGRPLEGWQGVENVEAGAQKAWVSQVHEHCFQKDRTRAPSAV